MKSTENIKSIVKIGASVIIDSSKSTENIKSIVKVASPNAEVTIKNAGIKSTEDLKAIAKVANCKVIFDLTEIDD